MTSFVRGDTFRMLCEVGDRAGAREYVLSEVDRCYLSGLINFEDAAWLYTHLDTPVERVMQFPQRHD